MSEAKSSVRALRPADADVARALVSAFIGGTRYAARTHEVLDAALAGSDEEHIGLVLPDTTDGAPDAGLSGITAIGAVAGASGAWRVHWLFAHSIASATLLASAAVDFARDRGARLLVAELPDDVPFEVASEAVADAGFIREGSIPDFVREGIALRLWVSRS